MNGSIVQHQADAKPGDRRSAPALTPNGTEVQFAASPRIGGAARRELPKGKGMPVEFGLALIQGKWKIPILSKLRQGPARLSHLRRSLPKVSKTVLTRNLHKMEKAGLVVRTDLSGKVPYVEYALSQSLGMAVTELIDTLEQWGSEHA